MRRALLDINVLLALLDSDHVDHKLARDWINAEIRHGWASCAITQNSFVRIISHPRYPNPVSPSQAIDLLDRAASTEHHEFWPCTISVLDSKLVEHNRLGHSTVSTTQDVYLGRRAGVRERPMRSTRLTPVAINRGNSGESRLTASSREALSWRYVGQVGLEPTT